MNVATTIPTTSATRTAQKAWRERRNTDTDNTASNDPMIDDTNGPPSIIVSGNNVSSSSARPAGLGISPANIMNKPEPSTRTPVAIGISDRPADTIGARPGTVGSRPPAAPHTSVRDSTSSASTKGSKK